MPDKCAECGGDDDWALGVVIKDKDGAEHVVRLCFACLAKRLEKKIIYGDKKQETNSGKK